MRKNHEKWINDFLENCELSNRSRFTIINYRADLYRFIEWFENHHSYEITKANSQTIGDYKNYLTFGEKLHPKKTMRTKIGGFLQKLFNKKSPNYVPRSPIAVNSRRRHLSAIKNFFEYLKQSHEDSSKLFQKNPVKNKLHSIKIKDEDIQHTKVLTQKDWKALTLMRKNHKENLIIHLLYYGGLRLAELTSLKYDNFSKSDKSITFIRKGGVRHTLFIQKSSLIFKLLDQWKSIQKKESEYLFTNRQNKNLSTRSMYTLIMKLFQRANLSKDLTPHSFRKACATLLYDRTKDLLLVRDYLNHSDAKVTQTYIANSQRIDEKIS